jgi:release factor glutamine methyltransferase
MLCTGRIENPSRRYQPNAAAALAGRLVRAGFIAAEQEATELLARAGGDDDLLAALVARRLTGEPLAWITGSVDFCGLRLRVDPGVYVPRWHTEALAHRAVERLSSSGTAIDLCTGCGAIARTLSTHHPAARVVASDIDRRAVECARANGVDAYSGDLLAPLPPGLRGRVDVVVGVVPYVPTAELALLQRDTFTFEARRVYHGGADGLQLIRRVAAETRDYLRPAGALLLEIGGDQADVLGAELERLGYAVIDVLADPDGDVRGIEATLGAATSGGTAGTDPLTRPERSCGSM